jgi:hypothetical protein
MGEAAAKDVVAVAGAVHPRRHQHLGVGAEVAAAGLDDVLARQAKEGAGQQPDAIGRAEAVGRFMAEIGTQALVGGMGPGRERQAAVRLQRRKVVLPADPLVSGEQLVLGGEHEPTATRAVQPRLQA